MVILSRIMYFSHQKFFSFQIVEGFDELVEISKIKVQHYKKFRKVIFIISMSIRFESDKRYSNSFPFEFPGLPEVDDLLGAEAECYDN